MNEPFGILETLADGSLEAEHVAPDAIRKSGGCRLLLGLTAASGDDAGTRGAARRVPHITSGRGGRQFGRSPLHCQKALASQLGSVLTGRLPRLQEPLPSKA